MATLQELADFQNRIGVDRLNWIYSQPRGRGGYWTWASQAGLSVDDFYKANEWFSKKNDVAAWNNATQDQKNKLAEAQKLSDQVTLQDVVNNPNLNAQQLANNSIIKYWSNESEAFSRVINAINNDPSKIKFVQGEEGLGITTGEHPGYDTLYLKPTSKENIYQFSTYNQVAGGNISGVLFADPKTGKVAPIIDATKQISYTPGTSGSFVGGLVSSIGSLVNDLGPLGQIGLAYLTGGLGSAIAEELVASELVSEAVSKTVGDALAKTLVDVAQGKDLSSSLTNSIIGAVVQTGSPTVASTITDVVQDKAIADILTSATLSAESTLLKGGDLNNAIKNAVSGAVGTGVGAETGSRMVGVIVGQLASGADLTQALSAAAYQQGKSDVAESKYTAPSVSFEGESALPATEITPPEEAPQAPPAEEVTQAPPTSEAVTDKEVLDAMAAEQEVQAPAEPAIETPTSFEVPVDESAVPLEGPTEAPVGFQEEASATPQVVDTEAVGAPDDVEGELPEVTVTAEAEPVDFDIPVPEPEPSADQQILDLIDTEPVDVSGTLPEVTVTAEPLPEVEGELPEVTVTPEPEQDDFDVVDFIPPDDVSGTLPEVTVTAEPWPEVEGELPEVTVTPEPEQDDFDVVDFIPPEDIVPDDIEIPEPPSEEVKPEKPIVISTVTPKPPEIKTKTDLGTVLQQPTPLAQLLTSYRGAGELEPPATGKPRKNVWNEASLRLKDALGL